MLKYKDKKAIRWVNDGIIYTIKKSDRPDKKLVALYEEGGKIRRIHFGGVRANGEPYEHFKDKTGLLDPKLNHGDKERRRLYRARHEPITNFKEPSPSLLSWFLLW